MLLRQVHLCKCTFAWTYKPRIFQVFDRDGSGKISGTELKYVLTRAGNMKLTDAEVEEMISAVDSDNDGMINFNELIKLFTGADNIEDLVDQDNKTKN